MLKTFISLFLVKKKAGSKCEIFGLALQLSQNQVYRVSMETIIRSLLIKCNFTRMRVFQMEDEAFVIHNPKIRKPINTA